ncbi:unnamed protein product [marine sediment metagenome]|uniref:Uncharacterized protein n=1 Tax=marine sediment metagenome TaxID=412755 RepID=X0ZZQ8_9ZZZZ
MQKPEHKPFIGECTRCHQNVVDRNYEYLLKTALCLDCKKERDSKYAKEYRENKKAREKKKYMNEYMKKYREKDAKLKHPIIKKPDNPKVIALRMNAFRRQPMPDLDGSMIKPPKSYQQLREESKARDKNK